MFLPPGHSLRLWWRNEKSNHAQSIHGTVSINLTFWEVLHSHLLLSIPVAMFQEQGHFWYTWCGRLGNYPHGEGNHKCLKSMLSTWCLLSAMVSNWRSKGISRLRSFQSHLEQARLGISIPEIVLESPSITAVCGTALVSLIHTLIQNLQIVEGEPNHDLAHLRD